MAQPVTLNFVHTPREDRGDGATREGWDAYLPGEDRPFGGVSRVVWADGRELVSYHYRRPGSSEFLGAARGVEAARAALQRQADRQARGR